MPSPELPEAPIGDSQPGGEQRKTATSPGETEETVHNGATELNSSDIPQTVVPNGTPFPPVIPFPGRGPPIALVAQSDRRGRPDRGRGGISQRHHAYHVPPVNVGYTYVYVDMYRVANS